MLRELNIIEIENVKGGCARASRIPGREDTGVGNPGNIHAGDIDINAITGPIFGEAVASAPPLPPGEGGDRPG